VKTKDLRRTLGWKPQFSGLKPKEKGVWRAKAPTPKALELPEKFQGELDLAEVVWVEVIRRRRLPGGRWSRRRCVLSRWRKIRVIDDVEELGAELDLKESEFA